MKNYKRLTELDNEMEKVHDTLKTVQRWHVKKVEVRGDFETLIYWLPWETSSKTIYATVMKVAIENELHRRYAELSREKQTLLNKQWWEFWK